MNNIIRPLRWWDWVSPQGEQEMIPFLRAYMGKGKQFRTPKRKWEDLWRLKRGDMNHVMGMRIGPTIKAFKGPKYQMGIICAAHFGVAAGGGGTEPNLQNITHSRSQALAGTQQRLIFAWDSDGSVVHDIGATTAVSVAYTELTTQTNDTNDHTNDWWPDQPETNEGLNWDIQYNDESLGGTGGTVAYLQTTAAANRTTATWYTLDTVSNDHGDGHQRGAICLIRANGNPKTPTSGTATLTVDIEIRTTTTGSAVTSNTLDLTLINSDMRLKDNIEFVGHSSNGVRLYTWTWNKIAQELGINTPEFGVIAQEHPYASSISKHGYLQVDYRLIF